MVEGAFRQASSQDWWRELGEPTATDYVRADLVKDWIAAKDAEITRLRAQLEFATLKLFSLTSTTTTTHDCRSDLQFTREKLRAVLAEPLYNQRGS